MLSPVLNSGNKPIVYFGKAETNPRVRLLSPDRHIDLPPILADTNMQAAYKLLTVNC
jgi:hypothetical protein